MARTTEIIIASIASSLITLFIIKMVAPLLGFQFPLDGDLVKIIVVGSVVSEIISGTVTRTVKRIIPG